MKDQERCSRKNMNSQQEESIASETVKPVSKAQARELSSQPVEASRADEALKQQESQAKGEPAVRSVKRQSEQYEQWISEEAQRAGEAICRRSQERSEHEPGEQSNGKQDDDTGGGAGFEADGRAISNRWNHDTGGQN